MLPSSLQALQFTCFVFTGFILFCVQLSSRDNELDNVKDRYNAAVKEVCSIVRVS